MRYILLLILFVFIGAKAQAENNTIDKRVNSSSTQDRYNLPEYDTFYKRSFFRQTNRVQKDAPALTIINEPYPPMDRTNNLVHMGRGNVVDAQQPQSLLISDDTPTDISPPPVKADMVTMEPAVSQAPEKIVETWRARKGESLYQVLNRWSERAGTRMTWSSVKSPKLTKNISFVGTYQDAVTHAMKVAGAQDMNSEWDKSPDVASPMNTSDDMMMPVGQSEQLVTSDVTSISSASSPAPLTPEPLPIRDVASLDAAEPMSLEPIQAPETLPQRARYYALAGTSLEQALRAWAGTQEFALVWQSNRDFKVKQTVSSNNDAEMAIRDILSMYDQDAERPVGTLYRDPRTSRPVLVVKSDKSRS